jgi:hypothetical protein
VVVGLIVDEGDVVAVIVVLVVGDAVGTVVSSSISRMKGGGTSPK